MGGFEPNSYWEGMMNGVDPGAEEFSNILNLLDFPMETLDGDGLGGDWDPSKCENMGPIPLDALTGFPPLTQSNAGSGSAKRVPSHNAPINIKSEWKEQANCVVGDKNGTNTPHQNSKSPESRAFQTPSPVSVLESNSSCSSGKSLGIKAEIFIPVRARSKRARPSKVNPWLLISPITRLASVAKKSLNSGKNREKKRRLSQLSNCSEGIENSPQQAVKKLPRELNILEKDKAAQRLVAIKKCTHCEVTKTPQWREGPMGPKTLCNACGVRYRSGRLFPEYRPAASPTFVPSLHSNSHRKVVEMRKKATQQEADSVAKDPQMSPLPEFVPMSSSYMFDYLC